MKLTKNHLMRTAVLLNCLAVLCEHGNAAPPTLHGATQTNGGFSFTWNTLAGQTYLVQHRTNLNQTNWNILGGLIRTTNASASYSDAMPPVPSERFYRVWVLATNSADTQKPTVVITAPSASQKWSNSVFTVKGTASDNTAVAAVFHQLNSNNWAATSTTNAWANWTASVALIPGTNIVCAYAVDTNSNISTTNSVSFVYVAPPSLTPTLLAGLTATAMSDGVSLFTVSFGTNTFSQSSADTNSNNNGVGGYTYIKLSTNTAQVTLTYTSPPTVTNQVSVLNLTFTSNSVCNFTNQDGVYTGTMTFTTATNLLPVSLAGKKIVLIDDNGEVATVDFGSGTFSEADSSGMENSGAYTFTAYSPVGALVKLNGTNGTSHLLVTFSSTNSGSSFAASSSNSNAPLVIKSGMFALPVASSSYTGTWIGQFNRTVNFHWGWYDINYVNHYTYDTPVTFTVRLTIAVRYSFTSSGLDWLDITNAICSHPYFGAQFGVVPTGSSSLILPHTPVNISSGVSVYVSFPNGTSLFNRWDSHMSLNGDLISNSAGNTQTSCDAPGIETANFPPNPPGYLESTGSRNFSAIHSTWCLVHSAR